MKEKDIIKKIIIILITISMIVIFNTSFAVNDNSIEEINSSEGNTNTENSSSNQSKTTGNGNTSNNSVNVNKNQTVNNNYSQKQTNSSTNNSVTQKKSSVATLSNLGITGEYDFSGFNSSKTLYNVTVPYDVETVEIYAKKGHVGQTLTGLGVKNLRVGSNAADVVVTAEDGVTTKKYTINIIRQTEEETKKEQEQLNVAENQENKENKENNEINKSLDLGLTNLKIKKVRLKPKFDINRYEYTATLWQDLNSLDIQAFSNQEDTNIEIIGNENLVEGENIITILVTNNNTDEIVTYQIIVNKDLSNPFLRDDRILYGSIAIAILFFILIIILIVKKVRKNRNNNYEYEYDFDNMVNGDIIPKALKEDKFKEKDQSEKSSNNSKGKRFK